MAYTNHHVIVYVYDLSQGMARQLSPALLGKQIEGIWHTSVCVFGKEFYFGGGICCDNPLNTPYGVPIQKHVMGETTKSEKDFLTFLSSISNRFTMATYHLLDNNCNNFSDESCMFLTGQHIPTYITGLPQDVLTTPFGTMLRPLIEQMQVGIQNMAGQHQVDLSSLPQPTHPLTDSDYNSSSNPIPSNASNPIISLSTSQGTTRCTVQTLIATPVLMKQADVAKVIVKLRQYLPSVKTDTVSDLTDALYKLEKEQAFPVLDLLRLRVLRRDENERIASLVPSLLKSYAQTGAVPSAQQMVLRCAANCFAYPLGAAILLAERSQEVVVEAVAIGLTSENYKVKQVAAATALNIAGAHMRSPTIPTLSCDGWVRLVYALVETISTYKSPQPDPSDNTLLWLLGSLEAFCLDNTEARDLAQALEAKKIVGEVEKRVDISDNVRTLAAEIVASL